MLTSKEQYKEECAEASLESLFHTRDTFEAAIAEAKYRVAAINDEINDRLSAKATERLSGGDGTTRIRLTDDVNIVAVRRKKVSWNTDALVSGLIRRGYDPAEFCDIKATVPERIYTSVSKDPEAGHIFEVLDQARTVALTPFTYKLETMK